MIGKRKTHLYTPAGYHPIPERVLQSFNMRSTLDLLKEYVETCRVYVDPYLLNELTYRKAINNQMTYQDIADYYREQVLEKINNQKETWKLMTNSNAVQKIKAGSLKRKNKRIQTRGG